MTAPATTWHKGQPVIWYGRQTAQTQFHWFCQVCQEMGMHERLSFVVTAGQAHQKVNHPDA